MSIILHRLLTTGETGYIGKHNSNYAMIETAIAALESLLYGTVGGAITAPNGFEAMLGSSNALIGSGSYAASTDGTQLTLTSGFAWRYDSKEVVQTASSSLLEFSGLSANTYYLHIATDGSVSRTTSSSGAFYSVVWDGSAFGTITLLANITWGAADWLAAQTSTALAATYLTLDSRLEAGEAKAVQGADAYTAGATKTTKAVDGGANVTLTVTESQASFFEFTGVLTANITVTFNATKMPELFSVKNSTTGDYTLTVKLTTGIVVPQGYTTFCVRNGTAIEAANTDAYIVAQTLPYAASVTLDWSQYDCVHITLTGDIEITNTNARKGQKCLIYLAQDGTGGHEVTWGAEVAFGAHISGVTLSSGPNLTDEIALSHNWVSGKYNVVSFAPGYPA